jgi:hypothetical protein
MSKKITNNNGLSLPIAVWLAYDGYDYSNDDSVISTTSLMKPIKQVVFGRRYKDADKEFDVSDFISSSMGTALHDSVELAWKNKDKTVDILNNMGYLNAEDIYDKVTFEKRTVKQVGKYKISGKFDMVFDGIVADIKSTSTWTYIYGSKDDDYKIQMSIYRWLNPELITNDFGYIEFIFTDWSAVKAKQDSSYPQGRTATKKIALMSIAETQKFVEDKLSEIQINELIEDDKLPDCTDEELWASADVWKVYKGASRARSMKNFALEADAYEFAATKAGSVVVLNKGEVKRCNYCSYQEFCSQYTRLKVKGLVK